MTERNHQQDADLAAAVIVIELGVVENTTDLTDAVRVVAESGVPHATRVHMAIRDVADDVIAVLAAQDPSRRIPPPGVAMIEHPSAAAPIREVLAQHFVLWAPRPDRGPRSGDWVCSCGLKFGFSDTAIDHVAEQVVSAQVSRRAAPNPVNGLTDPCPTPGYLGRHTAFGAGAISSPYVCHGCGTWFTLPDAARRIPPGKHDPEGGA